MVIVNRRTASAWIASALACSVTSARAADVRAFDFDFMSLEGEPMPLSQWKGKVLLVANTASFCGFTGQYADLVDVWRAYEQAGLVVIGAPSNDFRQESEDAKEIKSFCELTYGVEFPMTEPVHVKGDQAHPFFKWAALQSGRGVTWNFNKYLIGRDGNVITWMSSATRPTSARARREIEAALAAGA